VKYQPWFERYSELFSQESEFLEEAGFTLEEETLAEEGRVVFRGLSKAKPQRTLVISFPDSYPSFPPSICDDSNGELLIRHQDPSTRNFCLFGIGAGRWCATCTVSDAIAEVEGLLEKLEIADDDDSAPEPLTAVIPYYGSVTFFVPPGISDHDLTNIKFPAKFTFVLSKDIPNSPRKGFVTSVRFDTQSIGIDSEFPQFVAGPEQTGFLWRLSRGATFDDLVEIVQNNRSKSPTRKPHPEKWFAFVIDEDGSSAHSNREGWTIARASHGSGICFFRAFPFRENEYYARNSNAEVLREKRVAIVGCGCIGSKIAKSLAASGVSKITLFDFDFFEPYNSARHVLGLDSFGEAKLHALAKHLTLVNPFLTRDGNLKGLPHNLGGPFRESENRKVIEYLSECDLIIETTGVHHVSRWINEVAHDSGVPSIFASVTNGAWSGEIMRYVPKLTACWVCWLDEFYDSRPPGDDTKDGAFFAPGCNQPSFIGSAHETGSVAEITATIASDTLLTDFSSVNANFDYFRWNGRDETGRLILKSELFKVKADPSCYLKCGNR